MPKSKTIEPTVEPEPPSDRVTPKTPSPPSIKEIGGSGNFMWDISMIDRVALTSNSFTIDGEDCTKKMAATALRAFKPTDAIEGMLAAQAVALHYASLDCSRRAMIQGQPGEIASRLRKDAANSARAMVEMCEAIDRRRGKGPQVVRVERVVVNEGGQAIVGPVVAGASLPMSGQAPRAIAQAHPLPLPMLEAHPVEAGEGEG